MSFWHLRSQISPLMHASLVTEIALAEWICLHVFVCWQHCVSQTCCILATGVGCGPGPINGKCQQGARLLHHHVCQTKQERSSLCSATLCYIKVLMAVSSSFNCCKHPHQGGHSRPALAPCQYQATQATGWYKNVRMEGPGRAWWGVVCEREGEEDRKVGETDGKRMWKQVNEKKITFSVALQRQKGINMGGCKWKQDFLC